VRGLKPTTRLHPAPNVKKQWIYTSILQTSRLRATLSCQYTTLLPSPSISFKIASTLFFSWPTHIKKLYLALLGSPVLKSRLRQDFFYSTQPPDRLWNPPSFPRNGYRRSVPWVKRPRSEFDHSPRSSVEVSIEYQNGWAPEPI